VKIYITGRPGIGKSTVVLRVINALRGHGIKVGGILCPEVRGSLGRRIGFKIVDLLTNEEGWLAHKLMFKGGPRIGKYNVNIYDAINIGVKALSKALKEATVIVIDEVGPMELSVPKLKEEIVKVLTSGRNVLAVVHYRLRDRIILEVLKHYRKYEVTIYNRVRLPKIIIDEILK